MHSHWQRIMIATVLALALVGSVSAQSSVDTDLLDGVASALAQTAAVDSLHLESQSLTETSTGQESSFGAVISSSYDLARSGESWNLSGSQTTDTTTPNGSFQSTTEMIVIDGTVYMRIQRDAAAADGAAGQGNGFSLPEGWFDLSALEAEAQGGQRAFLGSSSQPSSLLDVLKVPLTASAVTALSELPADTIDGQTMRVIQVTFDSQALLDSDAASLVLGGAGRGGFAAGGPGGFGPGGGASGSDGADTTGGQVPPGQGAQGQPPDGAQQFGTPPTVDPANVSISFAIYIGEDGLIHRLYSVVATTMTPAADATTSLSTTTTSVTDFSAFNQSVAIVAPESGT